MPQTTPPPPIPPAAQPSSQPALPPLSERLSRALGASTSSSDASSPGVVSSPGTSTGGASTPPPPPPGLFAYGTLTLDPVISALLDRVPPSRSVRAPGWRAAGLPGLPYPGLVPQRSETPSAAGGGSGAPGRLYLDLGARDWAILDAFENPEYEIGLVTLEHGDKALAYTWPDVAESEGGQGKALGTTWTIDWAVEDKQGMALYLERCVGWRQAWEEEAAQSG